MNILIATLGSHGDMHPFLGIGAELQSRGHHVKIMAPSIYENLTTQLNLKFIPIGSAKLFDEFAGHPEIFHPTRGFKRIAEGTSAMLGEYYEKILEHHVPGKTILVFSTLVLAARVAQETHNIPGVSVHLSPSIFRTVYDTPILSPLPLRAWQPKWVKRFFYGFADKLVIDRFLGKPLNEFRRQFGLAPVSHIFDQWLHSPQRVIGLFPEWFAAKQPDWPAQTILTGFPMFDERDVTPMPQKLEEFLSAGDAPIAFTPGSGMRHGQDFFKAAVGACTQIGRRGILLTRHLDHLPSDLPNNVIHVDYAPFSQLLPRCAVLVHHCGIGTSSQALAAGIPQLAMPMAHDQPDNAERMRKMGVAEVVPAGRFNVKTASKALEKLLASSEVPRKAREIATKFHVRHPLAQTADVIEKVL